jgi:putative endopeptidase
MKHTILPILAAAGILAAVPACKQKAQQEEQVAVGIDPANMDTTVRPQDDFYRYANGNWLKKNPVPATESRWGSFSAIQEENLTKLKGLLEEAAKQPAKDGSNAQKIGDYYASYMDSVRKNADGIKPLQPLFDKVNALKSNGELVDLIGDLTLRGARVFWGVYVSQDPKMSDRNITQVNQGGLGLPDRDYYTKSDPDSKKMQEQYLAHVTTMFTKMGDSEVDAKTHANQVYAFETRLAKASMTNVELRDIEKQYNKYTMKEMATRYPNSKWEQFLKTIGINGAQEVIVGQPKFFAEADAMIKSAKIEDWKQYLRWCLINSFSDKLSDDVASTDFAFYGTILNGQKQQKPRWKRAISEVDGVLGEALGQLFVEKYFPAESKKRVNEMVDNLILAYRERINGLDWMSKETKSKAQLKLNTVIKKLGYPDKWRDYSAMVIGKKSHLENYMAAYTFELKRNFDKLNKPVDKMEWFMSPPTVNAYYNPTTNEITFPAGIMQPPFFFSDADDAVNYAAIGAVIGHELTHGFDDQGSQFDEMGNMKNWWTEEDKAKFTSKTGMVVNQFNQYVAMDSLHVNGELTLGENIADLGGVAIAYAAFQKTEQAKKGEKLGGFTPNQRFFLSWAQVWRTNYTDAALKKQVNTNPHSPSMFRANGPLTNLNEFYEAWGVKKGDKMYREPADRAKIW